MPCGERLHPWSKARPMLGATAALAGQLVWVCRRCGPLIELERAGMLRTFAACPVRIVADEAGAAQALAALHLVVTTADRASKLRGEADHAARLDPIHLDTSSISRRAPFDGLRSVRNVSRHKPTRTLTTAARHVERSAQTMLRSS